MKCAYMYVWVKKDAWANCVTYRNIKLKAISLSDQSYSQAYKENCAWNRKAFSSRGYLIVLTICSDMTWKWITQQFFFHIDCTTFVNNSNS